MDHEPKTIAKLRRIQIGFFLAHFVLIVVGATHFAVEDDKFLGLITALIVLMALWELFGSSSLLRTPVDELQVWSIAERPLRWYEWLVVAPVVALTVAQLLAVTLLDPAAMISVIAMVPFLFTMLFAPLILVFWTFNRSIVRMLPTALSIGFRPPPPGSERWDELRSEEPVVKELMLVALLFWGCLDLQLLLLTIWSSSTGFLLFWGILTTGLLKEVPLTRKPKPAAFPIGR